MVAAYHRAGFQPTTTRAGDGITGPCPCCGGTDRVWIGSLPDGGPPWMAWSHGCSFEDMRSTLGRDASGQANGGGPGHTPVYSYTDEAGTPVFEVERRRAAGGRGQQFRPRHTAADGAVVWKLPPAGRGLVYHLPAVKRAIKNQDLVVVVAGETDADRLTSLPRCTPGNAGGASAAGRRSNWTPRHAAHVSGAARVVVIPDADAAGLAHAESVARSLAGKVERVQVVDIAAFGHVKGSCYDVSNWLDTHANADHNLEALTAILNDASDYQPQQPATAAETEHPPPHPPDPDVIDTGRLRGPATTRTRRDAVGRDRCRGTHDRPWSGRQRWHVGGRGRRARISARRPPGICPRPSGRPGFCTTPPLTSPLARTTWATTFWNSITAPSPRLKREDSGSRALREGRGVPTVLSSFQPPRRSCSAKDGTSAAPSAAWMGHGGSSKWRTSTPGRICFLSPSLRGLRTSHPAGGSRPPAAPPQAQAHDHLSVTR